MTITNDMVRRVAWDLYKDQYAAGATVADLARRSGLSRSTITDRLKKDGVFIAGRKGGAPKQVECQNGHSMEEHGRYIDADHPEKGRYCRRCRQEREGWGLDGEV